MGKGKDYYISVYDNYVKDYLQKYEEENGNLDKADSMESIETAEEIAGYYLSVYGEEALDTWLENLTYGIGHSTDKEVTKILCRLDTEVL